MGFEMMYDKRICKVFISHAWNYRNEYYKLEKMLDDSPDFMWQNIFPGFATPDQDPTEKLEEAIRRQIYSCDVVLIISDLYNTSRKWIRKEIEIARGIGKPIIGIHSRCHEETPYEVTYAAAEMLDWEDPDLVDTIVKYALGRARHDEEGGTGASRSPVGLF